MTKYLKNKIYKMVEFFNLQNRRVCTTPHIAWFLYPKLEWRFPLVACCALWNISLLFSKAVSSQEQHGHPNDVKWYLISVDKNTVTIKVKQVSWWNVTYFADHQGYYHTNILKDEQLINPKSAGLKPNGSPTGDTT